MDEETDDAEFKIVKDNLIWQTVLFGKARGLITWYEFWVYTCAGGRTVQEREYMVPNDDERLD